VAISLLTKLAAVALLSEGQSCHATENRVTFIVIRFVIPVVFNKLIRVGCMFLYNTTYFI